jgi:RsiW-degrading membrane proteinase PrsW (M82 family)
MAQLWYYEERGERRGPVDREALDKLIRSGAVLPATRVWSSSLSEWTPASFVSGLVPEPPPLPRRSRATVPGIPRKPPASRTNPLLLIGRKISAVADVPTLARIPLSEILMGGLARRTPLEDIERTFDVGTLDTTPPLSAVESGWPIPRVFWRILGLSVLTYVLLRLALGQWAEMNLVPALIIVGSFAIPFSLLVLLFEMNSPRNVSVYQVGRLLVTGGVLGIIATFALSTMFPGSGSGRFVPALGTGMIEETAKMSALWLVVFNTRYRWTLNGALFGGAIGAGFEAFEDAGYILDGSLLNGKINLPALFGEVFERAGTVPGGHLIWTALIGAAIWKVKGDKPFDVAMLFSGTVLRRWAIVVVLHGLWDTQWGTPLLRELILTVLGWYLLLAVLVDGLDQVDVAKKAEKASP